MFMRINKQIAMVGILGLVLVLATAVYTQSAAAITAQGGGFGGVNPGGFVTVTVPHGHPSTGGATGAHQG